MNEEKKTLKDIFNRKFKVWMTPEMADVIIRTLMDQELALRKNRTASYEVMKFVCLLDIGIHQTTNWCMTDSAGCGLLNTLNAFKREFAVEIKDDRDYTLDDFNFTK